MDGFSLMCDSENEDEKDPLIMNTNNSSAMEATSTVSVYVPARPFKKVYSTPSSPKKT
jgi:hypothetical protein